MSVLHVLRDPVDPRAAAVIRAQAEQGVAMNLLLLGPDGPAPSVGAPVFAVGEGAPEGAEPVSWERALELMFDADTVVAW